MAENKNNKMSKQTKQSTLRLIIQCISFAFHNGYVAGWVKGKIYTGDNKMFCVPGLNCYSCPGAIGSCPIGSLQAVLDASGFHISLYVIGFIGAVGVFCGRFVCGWLCPFGLIQDLIYRIPFFKKIKNLPGHKYLRYLRFVILAVFVIALPMGIRNQSGVGSPWFCEYICPSGTLLGGIPLLIANPELRTLVGARFIWKAALLIIILIAALLSDRPFCKYICPLGALYGLANPISIYRYKVDENACTQCGACQKACGGDIKVWQTPNSIDCIRCGKCIASCPTGALTTTFAFRKVTEDAQHEVVSAAEISATPVSSIADSSETVPETTVTTPAKTLSTGRKVAIIISGILCLGVSIYLLYQAIGLIIVIVGSASISNIMSFLQYVMGYLFMIVPTFMTVILGIGLIAGATFKPDVYEKVRRWPTRILLTAAIGFGLTYIGYIIITILMAGAFSADALLYAFMLSFTAVIMGVLIAVVNLIAYLINK